MTCVGSVADSIGVRWEIIFANDGYSFSSSFAT